MNPPALGPRDGVGGLPDAPRRAIDGAIRRFLDGVELEATLGRAVAHAVLGGGKRIRPLLCYHTCQACGGAGGEDVLGACVAVELVHAFSLVHDDLPSMDDDETRRGLPTVHVAFGEGMGVLAGDALLALAFEALAQGIDTPAVLGGCVRSLARATRLMTSGQAMDLLADGANASASLEEINAIHERKTGALIRSACEMGGLIAGASASAMEAVGAYGDALGLMFQAVDDLIDVEQSGEHAGKRTGKDAGKATLVGAIGARATRERISVLGEECSRSARVLGEGGAVLVQISELLARRTR